MEFNIKMDKNEYFKCSMYYMRKFFGLREILLLLFLLVASVLLYVLAEIFIIFIFFGITALVLLFTFVLFVWTSLAGFKHDCIKQGIAVQKLSFSETELNVVSEKSDGEAVFSELHPYERLEGVVIKNRFIYIYAAVAVFYYLRPREIGEREFLELKEYLREHVPAEKFKFKKVKRMFPKRPKVTIEGDIPPKE